MTNDLLVTAVLFLPLIGLIPIFVLPKARENQIKWVALGVSILDFALGLLLLAGFDPNTAALQHVHKVPWLSFGTVNIQYYVGVDGLSLLLVMLTLFIMPLAILFSLYNVK